MEYYVLAIISAIVGVFFGIVALMIGIGGGLMYVPYLLFVIGAEENATIISTSVIFFTSTSGSLKYHSQNRIDKRTAFIYLTLAIPASILGRLLKQFYITDVDLLKLLFAILVGFTALFNLYKIYKQGKMATNKTDTSQAKTGWVEHRRLETEDGSVFEYDVKLGIGSLFALFGGFIAGFLGIGGGIIYVPVLTSISGVPIHVAAATSSFMIVFVTLTVLITYLILGNSLDIVLKWGIPLAIGAVIGARVGALKARKIESKKLLSGFWVIALISSIRMALGVL